VTVAVLNPDSVAALAVRDADIEIARTRGTGPGGQHRNKTDSCIVATYKPTGQSVRIDMRSQHRNLILAVRVLRARIAAAAETERAREKNDVRRAQLGSGMRGDKVRTYRVRDNLVTDHRTGQRWRLDAWQRGEW
jgi:peptide chain release factor 1